MRSKRRGESTIHDDLFIKKMQEGNQQALRVIIERYKNHVFKVIFAVVRDAQEAEDLTQETFIKMVDALSTYQSQGFKTWLSRIALHKAIDFHRKKRKSMEDLLAFDQEYEHLIKVNSVEQAFLEQEQISLVHQSVDKMPVNYRHVVYSYYIEGKTYSEIANQYQMAEKTVEMRLYRARKWMKTNWEEGDFK